MGLSVILFFLWVCLLKNGTWSKGLNSVLSPLCKHWHIVEYKMDCISNNLRNIFCRGLEGVVVCRWSFESLFLSGVGVNSSCGLCWPVLAPQFSFLQIVTICNCVKSVMFLFWGSRGYWERGKDLHDAKQQDILKYYLDVTNANIKFCESSTIIFEMHGNFEYGKNMTSIPKKYFKIFERQLWLNPNHIKTSTWKNKEFLPLSSYFIQNSKPLGISAQARHIAD